MAGYKYITKYKLQIFLSSVKVNTFEFYKCCVMKLVKLVTLAKAEGCPSWQPVEATKELIPIWKNICNHYLVNH